MFQTISGVEVYVVDLTAGIPDLPIHSSDDQTLASYALALNAAIRQGIVREPGKYGISVTEAGDHWSIFRINEDQEPVSTSFFRIVPDMRDIYRFIPEPVTT